ncbi:methyltransferase, partial [Escherichia coli]|uniref:methyltransferase n=1 Tax=Escherichia coli TaxID=562 RepID=UPI0028E05BBD
DPRARFTWADATQGRPGPFDAVVMNPPFHNGRAADPALGLAFIRAAAHALTPSGTLWMVANRHLPYEAALREAFREVEEV